MLPLVNLSEDPGNDYFVDGLTDEIIRQASGIAGLTVRSRTSSFALKGRPRTVREAASQLNVEYIVEGSVTRSGPQVRITAQLVRVRDDVPLWTGTFRSAGEGCPRDRAGDFSRDRQRLAVKTRARSRRYDTEAYDLYLRARDGWKCAFTWRRRGDRVVRAGDRQGPSIAPAYAGLAVAYAFRSFQAQIDPHRVEELDKMRAAAERAIQLDPLLAEAHGALGAAYARNGRWDLAERSFRRAIEIDPSLSTTRHAFARFVLWPLGRMDEAVREARAGAGNDPLSAQGALRVSGGAVVGGPIR